MVLLAYSLLLDGAGFFCLRIAPLVLFYPDKSRLVFLKQMSGLGKEAGLYFCDVLFCKDKYRILFYLLFLCSSGVLSTCYLYNEAEICFFAILSICFLYCDLPQRFFL